MTALPDLIVRLEACEGPSRELDLEIERAKVGPDWDIYVVDAVPALLMSARAMMRPAGSADEGTHVRVGDYTSSVDSALTLVPEGWRVVFAQWDPEGAEVTLGTMLGAYAYHNETARTPALALCIASLRARLAQESDVQRLEGE